MLAHEDGVIDKLSHETTVMTMGGPEALCFRKQYHLEAVECISCTTERDCKHLQWFLAILYRESRKRTFIHNLPNPIKRHVDRITVDRNSLTACFVGLQIQHEVGKHLVGPRIEALVMSALVARQLVKSELSCATWLWRRGWQRRWLGR